MRLCFGVRSEATVKNRSYNGAIFLRIFMRIAMSDFCHSERGAPIPERAASGRMHPKAKPWIVVLAENVCFCYARGMSSLVYSSGREDNYADTLSW